MKNDALFKYMLLDQNPSTQPQCGNSRIFLVTLQVHIMRNYFPFRKQPKRANAPRSSGAQIIINAFLGPLQFSNGLIPIDLGTCALSKYNALNLKKHYENGKIQIFTIFRVFILPDF